MPVLTLPSIPFASLCTGRNFTRDRLHSLPDPLDCDSSQVEILHNKVVIDV